MDAPSYDDQAHAYDARVGLGIPVCQAIAVHIRQLCGPGVIAEWGCGTGEIGVQLGAPYVGLDRSAAMLDVFRQRSPDADLRLADGNEPWPLEDRSVAAVFGSRSLHLMNPDHLAEECRRVQVADGWVLIGRVQRDRDSLRDRMRRRMQGLLKEFGYQPRDGRSRGRRLFEVLGLDAETTRVVSWPVSHSPGKALAAWADKPGLAGILPDPSHKALILHALADEFGDSDASESSVEWYTVAAARWKANP